MKLEGSVEVKADAQHVWQALLDPKILARCIPGVQKMESSGDHAYTATMQVGVGAVKGNYTGKVHLLDLEPPKRFRMRVEGKGAPGFLKGEGSLELVAANGGTQVRYLGDVTVGGMVAAVGQRLIGATAKMIIEQFFTTLTAEVQKLK